MYISELYIEQFGGITNKKITLDSTLNLIIGENESGKSTVCAFIKYVLYGFDGKGEKDRHSSLATGNALGSLVVVHDDKKYRIQRKNNKSVSIFDEESGMEFSDWKSVSLTPGEYFLDIPSSLYTRAVYVSQSDGARLDGNTASAINNLLLTGDEAINLKRARKTLDETRKALKLKKGLGGKISELENDISVAKIKLGQALSTKKEIEKYKSDLYDTENEISNLKKRITAAKSASEHAKSLQIRSKLEEQKAFKEKSQKNKILLEALIEENTYNGFLPDSEYVANLSSLQTEIGVYTEELTGKEEQLKRFADVKNEPAAYSTYCNLGKKENILQKARELEAKTKLFGALAVALTCICAISLVLAALSFSGGTLGFLKIPSIIALSLSVIAMAFSFALKYRCKNALVEFIKPLGAVDLTNLEYVCDVCESYGNSQKSADTSLISESIEETKEKLKEKSEKLAALLSQWGKTNVNRAVEDYKTFTEKRQKFTEEYEKAENGLSAANLFLTAFTKEEIALAASLDISAIDDTPSGENPDTLQELLDAANNRKNDLNILIAQNESGTLNIEQIEEEIDKKSALRDEYVFKYNAIELAIQSLDTAEINIRSTVSPFLSAEASILFDKITNGRYDKLRLDSEMNLSYVKSETDTVTSGDYLSMGSADLAWLCLRLALHKKLSESTDLPIILDEALVYFDDNRLSLIISELTEIAENGTQILLFSASSRECAMLGGAGNIIRLA